MQHEPQVTGTIDALAEATRHLADPGLTLQAKGVLALLITGIAHDAAGILRVTLEDPAIVLRALAELRAAGVVA